MYYEFTKKLDSLTSQQASRLATFRQDFFKFATSTETNVDFATAAVRDLIDNLPNNGAIHVSDITGYEIKWFPNPEKCQAFYKSLGRIQVFTHSLRDSIELSPIYWLSLSDRLLNSITKSLNNTLLDSLWSSRITTLSESLYECAWSSLVDLPWIAQYSFLSDLPGINLPPEILGGLGALETTLRHSFAVWVAPKNVILCKKPIRVEIQDNQVAGLEFED